MFKKGLMILLSVVMVLSFAAVSQAAPWKAKNDHKFFAKHNWKLLDIDSHWAKQSIEAMASYGIILGYPDMTFRPNASVSNFEAIMMISRAAGFEVSTTTSNQSSDDRFPYWMQDCIDYAVDKGILEESELDDLNGNQAAKRYQVAVWATRAMGLEVDDALKFEDMDDIPFYARPYVGGMSMKGFMIGYPGNVFQPNKAVSRAELSTVLYRILQAQDNVSNSDDNRNLHLETLNPGDGSYSVDTDTGKLTAEFNLDICAVEDLDKVMDGITVVNETYGEEVDISEVVISGNTLTITLENSLENDSTYRVTVEGDLIESEESGENFAGISGSEWQFTTKESFYIEKLTPENDDTSVDSTGVLTASFSGDISVVSGKSLLEAVSIYNKTDNTQVDIDKVEIDGDTLTITLEKSLEGNSTFEVTIKSNYLEDKDTGLNFDGLDGSDWRFTTE